MQFTADAIPGIVDGTITLTFRRWSRAQAKRGGRYRMWDIMIEVSDVRTVAARDITDVEARRAGSADAASLIERLEAAPDDTVYRVEFHYAGPDDRIARRNVAALDLEQRTAIQGRLDRMDRASSTGPWTRKTLRLIATYPGVVSTTLARQSGADRAPFKVNVRKLKEIGLTESLEVGYRLSPLGQQFLAVDPTDSVSSTNR